MTAENTFAATIDERIALADDRLTLREMQVASYLSEHRDDVIFMSAADITAAVSVSDATVIRTAQAPGYSGLSELKKEIRKSLHMRLSPAFHYTGRLDELGDDQATSLNQALAGRIELLEEARKTLARVGSRKRCA